MRNIFYVFLLPALGLLILAGCNKEGSKNSDYFRPDDDGLVVVNLDDEQTFYSLSTGKRADNAKSYPFVDLFHDGIALVRTEDDEYKYIKSDFSDLSKDRYENATIFSDGVAWVAKAKEHLSVIDRTGKAIFRFDEAETATPFFCGVSVFFNAKGQAGVIDKNGRIVVESGLYDSIVIPELQGKCLGDGYLEVIRKGKGGLIDTNGKDIITCEYASLDYVGNNRCIVKEHDKYGVIDLAGKTILETDYDFIQATPSGEYIIGIYKSSVNGTRYGLADSKGKEVLDPQFRSLEMGSDKNLLLAENKNSNILLVDRLGNELSEKRFEEARFDPFGNIIVKTENGYGVINSQIEWLVRDRYDELYPLTRNCYLVDMDDDHGVINTKGEYVIKPREEISYVRAWSYAQYASSQYLDMEGLVNYIKSCRDEIGKISDFKTMSNRYRLDESYGLQTARVFDEHYDVLPEYSVFVDYTTSRDKVETGRDSYYIYYKYVTNYHYYVKYDTFSVELNEKAYKYRDDVIKAITEAFGSNKVSVSGDMVYIER